MAVSYLIQPFFGLTSVLRDLSFIFQIEDIGCIVLHVCVCLYILNISFCLQRVLYCGEENFHLHTGGSKKACS